MGGFLKRLIGGALTPLIDQVSEAGARVLRKLALFCVAGLAALVTLISATVAFGLWVASMRGGIAGALAVAALYLFIAIVAVAIALWPRRAKSAAAQGDASAAAAEAKAGKDAEIDAFTAPLLSALQRLGLRKEQLAVLAGASVAKQLGPLPLVGLAILAGFLIGRTWRGLFSSDAIASLLSSDLIASLFQRPDEAEDGDIEEPAPGPEVDLRDAA